MSDGDARKSMQIVLIKVANVYACHISVKTQIIRQHESMEGLDNAEENRHQYNAASTIAIDHHHTGGLNNGGNMKICCVADT